ncbi:unnamed protein product [Bursaphelenchus okinawaensis]|uniref:tRNA-guanine(15) transglycosylase-like domain-containing protein n=1 Tax=Bursaphelenchus okinawaensis TaxID=465554 RepID=A0A811L8T8_9BILA|nr:unnamed protein product [Bursaphelenchus okinawaensis]CAG9119212.1 unnamed protein product [Bursaphelenchus okinawaensis]
MVKFVVSRHCGLARIGRLTEWGLPSRIDPDDKMQCILDHQTPTFMVYTRGGHVPHLTWDTFNTKVNIQQRPIFHVSYGSVSELMQHCRKTNKPLSDYMGMPEDALVHFSLFDPLGKRVTGLNRTKDIAIWTKGGKQMINVESYKDIVTTVQANTVGSMLDYATPPSCHNKRLSKAVQRTTAFWDEAYNFETLYCAPFLTLGGGQSHFHRATLSKTAAVSTHAAGYAVDLLEYSHNTNNDTKRPFNVEEISDLLQHSFDGLPVNKPRLVEGAFDPTEIFELIRLGVDIFDTSYAILMAEQGKAFRVSDEFPQENTFKTTDFTSDTYQNDLTPIVDDCTCYSCSNYTKAYLTHLFNTHELLGPMLTVIHNLSEFDRFFEMLRRFLRSDQSW